MLDIRATAYVSPVAEVPFASVALTVRITNSADETGYVTGKFRIYNSITGQRIHTSAIIPLSLAAGQSTDVSALTPFDPPAPATSTYFVNFDGLARNELVPDGISFALGSFDFDVLPTGMGPAPAAHHATHEPGGSDPVTGTPPGAHATTHENGGSDEMDVSGLSGELADDQPPLEHDHKKHTGIYRENDFHTTTYHPWVAAAINSGTAATQTGSALHPGIIRLLSSTTPDSGYAIRVSTVCMLMAGSEETDFWFRPQTLAGTTIRAGFLDATAITPPLDGCYTYMDPVTAKLTGRTMTNSASSTTPTDYQLVTNTWYMTRVRVNADASRVDFYLYDEAGTLLWTDYLTTNIPTATGRETGHGVLATNSGTTAVALIDLDKFTFYIPDRRPAI